MPTQSKSPYESRVKAGIAWLEENAPEGWKGKIDLQKLDLCSQYDCILGQIYGHYLDSPSRAREHPRPAKNGFAIDGDIPYFSFSALTVEWKRQLRPLLGKKVKPKKRP